MTENERLGLALTLRPANPLDGPAAANEVLLSLLAEGEEYKASARDWTKWIELVMLILQVLIDSGVLGADEVADSVEKIYDTAFTCHCKVKRIQEGR